MYEERTYLFTSAPMRTTATATETQRTMAQPPPPPPMYYKSPNHRLKILLVLWPLADRGRASCASALLAGPWMVMVLGLGVLLAGPFWHCWRQRMTTTIGGNKLDFCPSDWWCGWYSGSLDFEAITGEWRSHRKSISLRISRILSRSVDLKVHYSNLFFRWTGFGFPTRWGGKRGKPEGNRLVKLKSYRVLKDMGDLHILWIHLACEYSIVFEMNQKWRKPIQRIIDISPGIISPVDL